MRSLQAVDGTLIGEPSVRVGSPRGRPPFVAECPAGAASYVLEETPQREKNNLGCEELWDGTHATTRLCV